MSETCETITIKGAGGEPTRINASDFDPAKHEVYTAPEAVQTIQPTAEEIAAKEAAEAAAKAVPGSTGAQAPAGQPIPGAAAPRGAAKP